MSKGRYCTLCACDVRREGKRGGGGGGEESEYVYMYSVHVFGGSFVVTLM